MAELTLPQGTISYRTVGPEDPAEPPVVFIHGLLVDGRLWDPVAERLAAEGIRSYLPDLPLGSHRRPMRPDADLSPRGIADLIDGFLEQQGLTDVTLVGNDTGGALCQFMIDAHPQRIGRLLLTNCDAFDQFPPPPFDRLVAAARRPALSALLLGPMRVTALRHSPLGFGLLAHRFDPHLTRDWLAPALDSGDIRSDIARFARGVDPAALLEVSRRLGAFDRPVRIVWGEGDRVFKPALGRRLAEAFPHGSYTAVPGARTFLSFDAPEVVAREITALGATSGQPAGEGDGKSASTSVPRPRR